MFVSPSTIVPSTSRAHKRTALSVAGRTVPLILRTRLDSRTACSKLPVTSVSAARKRLPNEWPLKPSPVSKRYRKRSVTRASFLESATKQFRMSPGGKIPSSFCRRPELPPSSVTVTTAGEPHLEERIDDTAITLGHERVEDRIQELSYPEDDQDGTQPHEDVAEPLGREEVGDEIVDDLVDVQLGPLVGQPPIDAVDEEHAAEQREQEPTLDPQARDDPADAPQQR